MKKAKKTNKKKKKKDFIGKVGYYYQPNDATYKIINGISLKRKINFKRKICKDKRSPLLG